MNYQKLNTLNHEWLTIVLEAEGELKVFWSVVNKYAKPIVIMQNDELVFESYGDFIGRAIRKEKLPDYMSLNMFKHYFVNELSEFYEERAREEEKRAKLVNPLTPKDVECD